MNEGFFWRIFKQDANAAKRRGPEPEPVHRLHYMHPDKGTSAGYVEQVVKRGHLRFTITSNVGNRVENVPVDSLVDGMNKIEWLTYESRKQQEKQ